MQRAPESHSPRSVAIADWPGLFAKMGNLGRPLLGAKSWGANPSDCIEQTMRKEKTPRSVRQWMTREGSWGALDERI